MPSIGHRQIGPQGFGAMGLSSFYGPADDAQSIATLHRAVDLGVNFFDTASAYGAGHNETLLGKAFAGNRDIVTVASKFTHRAGSSDAPISARSAVEASLTRLGFDHIDLYYLHRIDPLIPVEDSVGELGRLKDEGKIGGVGICEASAAQLRRAHATYPLAALQSEYSLWTRDIEAQILPAAQELGIALVAYSPLGRGFLAGAAPGGAQDRRNEHPRFQPEAMSANEHRRQVIEDVAARIGATSAQICLAWTIAKKAVPIPGTRHIGHLEANWAANDLMLAADDMARLEAAFPQGSTVGNRYPVDQMALVPPTN